LETAADEILLYMRTNYLAANAAKTKFIMFGRKTSKKIRVGSGFLEESKSEDLLGIKISKSLTWARQVEGLKMELSKRIGIIQRPFPPTAQTHNAESSNTIVHVKVTICTRNFH
jgi:hypothetical protein